jgi:DNA-binding response OmpR family regulator
MNKKVFLVDDESEVTDYMEDFFYDMGLDVAKTNSPTDANRLIEEFQPDVVLLDVQMPGRDGISILKELKKKMPHIKVIMFTGVDDPKVVEEILQIGADHYMIKPVSINEIKKVVLGFFEPA